MKEAKLKIRPLVNSNRRVVISNFPPIIPDELIINALKNVEVNPVSPISNLRASIVKPGRSHILSFRKQFYINEEDQKLLPQLLEINFEETTY